MLLRLLILFFLLSSAGLSAQCAEFTLVSVECVEDNGEVIVFSAIPPDDWFGVTDFYVINATSGDTLAEPLYEFGPGFTLSGEFGPGVFNFVLDLVGLCTETIQILLPETCGFPNTGCCGEVSGQTWFDANGDGVLDAGEDPLGASVILEDTDGNQISIVETDINGSYQFTGLSAGVDFVLRFEPMTDDLLLPTIFQAGGSTTGTSDMRFDFRTDPFRLTVGEELSGIDAGFVSCDLSVAVADDEVSCNADCNGALNAEITGGVPPFTYAWSNGATGSSISGLCTFEYSVTVTDALGCSSVASGEVREVGPISLVTTATTVICAGVCDGTATVDVTGGTAPYTFEWSGEGGFIQTTQTATDLCAGFHRVRVTDADGCAVTATAILDELAPPNYEVITTDNFCNGECAGSISVVVPDGTEVSWDNGVTGPTISGLCAGTYQAMITTTEGCVSVVFATVAEPEDIDIFLEVTNAQCGGACDGLITSAVTGGTPPYTYFWSDGTTQSICPLACEGEYTVTITDSNGCEAVATATVEAGPITTARVHRSGGSCDPDGAPYTAQIQVEGNPDATYTYEWSYNGISEFGGPEFPDAPPFTEFSVTVTDVDTECRAIISDITYEQRDIITLFSPVFATECLTAQGLVEQFELFPEGDIQLVLPEGDTIPYGDGSLVLTGGDYTILALSSDQTCQRIIPLTLILNPFPMIEETEFIPSQDCSVGGCIDLLGNFDEPVALVNLEITATSPSGDTFPINSLSLCGVEEPGLWSFTLEDGCVAQMVTVVVTLSEVLPCGSVEGILYSTPDIDCAPVPDAVPIPFTVIRIVSLDNEEVYFSFTNEIGYYALPLPVGNYRVTPLINGQEPQYACAETTVVIPDSEVITADLYSPGELMCPQMEVDICMWQQRRCFENSLFLYYYNAGNLPAEDAVLTVELDEYYTDISADYPFTQIGQTLIFELGDVPFCGTGWIRIDFTISCDAPLGETHCVNASITPDGFCEPAPGWNGSLVNIIEATCEGDSVRFLVTNVGDNPMTVPMSYVVVEDGIMMMQQPVETRPLNPAESFEVSIEANGSIYQLTTNQEPNAPTTNDPSLLVDGCGGEVVQGSSNLLSLGNGVPWQETICLENRGSWDPNDKTGYPTGHSGNMIKPGTRLDYNIRFQNTGTDTAFTVVIRDTIEKALDLSTFRIGASSHRYQMTIDTNRVLTFTFNNIELPDSTTDLAGSQGMISFTIDHDSSLQPGDLIENKAAIYFDFNEPIITNLSTHMIETMGLPTSLRPILAQRTAIKIFPNPVTQRLSIRLPEAGASQGDVFVVTDLYGRDLSILPAGRVQDGINVVDLPNGYYVLTLLDAAGRAKGRTPFVVSR